MGGVVVRHWLSTVLPSPVPFVDKLFGKSGGSVNKHAAVILRECGLREGPSRTDRAALLLTCFRLRGKLEYVTSRVPY